MTNLTSYFITVKRLVPDFC